MAPAPPSDSTNPGNADSGGNEVQKTTKGRRSVRVASPMKEVKKEEDDGVRFKIIPKKSKEKVPVGVVHRQKSAKPEKKLEPNHLGIMATVVLYSSPDLSLSHTEMRNAINEQFPTLSTNSYFSRALLQAARKVEILEEIEKYEGTRGRGWRVQTSQLAAMRKLVDEYVRDNAEEAKKYGIQDSSHFLRSKTKAGTRRSTATAASTATARIQTPVAKKIHGKTANGPPTTPVAKKTLKRKTDVTPGVVPNKRPRSCGAAAMPPVSSTTSTVQHGRTTRPRRAAACTPIDRYTPALSNRSMRSSRKPATSKNSTGQRGGGAPARKRIVKVELVDSDEDDDILIKDCVKAKPNDKIQNDNGMVVAKEEETSRPVLHFVPDTPKAIAPQEDGEAPQRDATEGIDDGQEEERELDVAPVMFPEEDETQNSFDDSMDLDDEMVLAKEEEGVEALLPKQHFVSDTNTNSTQEDESPETDAFYPQYIAGIDDGQEEEEIDVVTAMSPANNVMNYFEAQPLVQNDFEYPMVDSEYDMVLAKEEEGDVMPVPPKPLNTITGTHVSAPKEVEKDRVTVAPKELLHKNVGTDDREEDSRPAVVSCATSPIYVPDDIPVPPPPPIAAPAEQMIDDVIVLGEDEPVREDEPQPQEEEPQQAPQQQEIPSVIWASDGQIFTVENKIGHGSFANVHLVVDQQQRRYAMKVAMNNNNDMMRAGEDAFYDEVMRHGRHRHVAAKYPLFSFTHQGKTFRCELLDRYKADLFDVVFQHRVRFTPLHILQTIQQVCDALEYVNRLGFIHCDIKPDNIMLAHYETYQEGHRRYICHVDVRLIDFNVIIDREGVQGPLRFTGQSIPYRAPEMALEMRCDERIDSWSLGIIALQLLTKGRFFVVNDQDVHGMDSEMQNEIILGEMERLFAPVPSRMKEMSSFYKFRHQPMFNSIISRHHRCNENVRHIYHDLSRTGSISRKLKEILEDLLAVDVRSRAFPAYISTELRAFLR